MLVELLCRHHLVSLDVSMTLVVRHPDIDLQETILALTAHCCFECCHFFFGCSFSSVKSGPMCGPMTSVFLLIVIIYPFQKLYHP